MLLLFEEMPVILQLFWSYAVISNIHLPIFIWTDMYTLPFRHRRVDETSCLYYGTVSLENDEWYICESALRSELIGEIFK